MKAYIQSHEQQIMAATFSFAASGLRSLGYDIRLFEEHTLPPTDEPGDIVVGSVDITRKHLARLGVNLPSIDYPEELRYLFNRDIRKVFLKEVTGKKIAWPVFVKPEEEKLFCGTVISDEEDISALKEFDDDTPVFVSEIIDFAAEWRFFIRYNEIIGYAPYKGRSDCRCDIDTVRDAVSRYTSAPAGYAMDFGVSEDGKISLIEVNDGYSLCNYMLPSAKYAKLLTARWCELTGTEDFLKINSDI